MSQCFINIHLLVYALRMRVLFSRIRNNILRKKKKKRRGYNSWQLDVKRTSNSDNGRGNATRRKIRRTEGGLGLVKVSTRIEKHMKSGREGEGGSRSRKTSSSRREVEMREEKKRPSRAKTPSRKRGGGRPAAAAKQNANGSIPSRRRGVKTTLVETLSREERERERARARARASERSRRRGGRAITRPNGNGGVVSRERRR